MLQIWFDDSGKGHGPAFVLAGYLADVEEWRSFSDRWDVLLSSTDKGRRSLEYLKGYEAFGFRDQFRAWTERERDDRLMEFMPIIDDCSGKGLAIVIPHDPFARILKQKFQPFKNPYMFAYALSFSVMLHFAHGNPSRERIELIFDNNVIKPKQAEEAYKEIFRVYPPDVTALLGRSEPRFEDDKKFNALQASDLLAYCVRARYESGAKYEQVKRSPVYEVLAGGPAKLYEPGMYAIGNHTVLVEIGDAQMEDFKRRANQKRGS